MNAQNWIQRTALHCVTFYVEKSLTRPKLHGGSSSSSSLRLLSKVATDFSTPQLRRYRKIQTLKCSAEANDVYLYCTAYNRTTDAIISNVESDVAIPHLGTYA